MIDMKRKKIIKPTKNNMLKNKDQILISIAVFILLLTTMINWTVYSWLVLAAVIILLFAWYFKRS
jgi:uncharacterized membrane protein